jgi:hypothetical protein
MTDSIDGTAEAIDRYEPPRLILLDCERDRASKGSVVVAGTDRTAQTWVAGKQRERVTRGKPWPLENAEG